MAASSYPILTFDEAQLSPSLGYVFDHHWLDPYESVVSMLWKFAWLNRLPGHMVVAHVATRLLDPYEGFAATSDELDIRHVAGTLGISTKTVRVAVQHPQWRRNWCAQLRFCPRCMSRGYHGVVHQFGSEPRCPVHKCWLETECHSCGATSAYRINASLLDAPFRCANCRRHYGNAAASFVHRCPLPKPARTALARTFLG